MPMEAQKQLDSLFYPKGVAIVGASPNRNGRANQWINGYIKHGFQGKIFPIHPSADTILGFKAYPSVRDIPGEVDLVIFSVPFSVVLDVMQDCVAKGVKYVHLFTAGFSETGQEEQVELEKRLLEIAREGGVRLIGPNCMGIYCPDSGVTWSEDFPKTSGPVGFVSQSGQLASQFIWEGAMDGIRFSKVVSFGNASDLECHDFLNYIGQDDKTEILGAYIEGLKHGRPFFEFARRITRKKPFVVWKGGQTEGGARATRSHTASIAGSQKIWKALCR
ncbi:MAG: CoA-binding protein, partial [Deltaproteobacteria bacterium]|nr:CoA-binding protein [Deltaproteobacteria bacterium]